MLRAFLYGVSVLLLTLALVGLPSGWPVIPAGVLGALLLLALLFERYVYKPIRTEAPGPEWRRTDERFDDPRSGQLVTVYYNPRTYVAEAGSGP